MSVPMRVVHTIPQLVLENAKLLGDEPALVRRVSGDWETLTWSEYGAAVRRTARALIASGIEPGDRVAILSYNTPEWVIFDVAAMAIGAVPVGIYFSSSDVEIAELLERSNARIVLAQTTAQIAAVREASIESVELLVGIDDAQGDTVSWPEFLSLGDAVDPDVVDDRIAAIEWDDPATLMFTAAGYGSPVGVILTHDNLVAASRSSVDLFNVTQSDSALSYLPLSHIAEQIFTILAPAHVGYPVAFAQSIGRVRVDLLDIEPAIFFGVPLVWSGFERALRKQVEALTGAQARIANWSMGVSRDSIAARNAGSSRSPYLRAKVAVARRLFTDKARSAMGFANVRLAFSGAVSVDPSTLEYFAGIDLPVREVYGLSESTGPAVVTREGATRFGTVGLPMPGVEISIADDGEILIRGQSVFSGYLDDEDATGHALRDGWLHTGDLGGIGGDGLLTISGRKKDIIITAGGKNVDAGAVEPLLREDPLILDAVLVGDGHDQLGVLISVAEAFDGDDDLAFAQAEAVVERVNQRFSRAEQVRRIGLLPRPLSVDLGEVSPAGEVDRLVVVEHFTDEVAELYR
ncbi:MAG: AMP-binding protein [Actinomycetia bacterium]|nr:AMP-binding protein [Actinomycetes bacterium]